MLSNCRWSVVCQITSSPPWCIKGWTAADSHGIQFQGRSSLQALATSFRMPWIIFEAQIQSTCWGAQEVHCFQYINRSRFLCFDFKEDKGKITPAPLFFRLLCPTGMASYAQIYLGWMLWIYLSMLYICFIWDILNKKEKSYNMGYFWSK